MSRLLRIAAEELRCLLADRGALVVLVAGTLFYGFFYPLPYRDQVARAVPVAVVDLDRSAASRQLTRMIDATEQVGVVRVLRERAEAERLLRSGVVAGVVEIPDGFERRLLRGETGRVGAWGNAAYLLLYSQVAGGVSDAVGTFGAGLTLRRLEQAGVPPATAMALAQPLPLDIHELFNPGGGYGTYVVPAVLVLILQQTALIAIGMVSVGRRDGDRQGGEPPLGDVLGRMLAYLPVQLLLALVLLVFVHGVYGFPRQASLPLALWTLLPFLLATSAFGLLLGEVFGSRETVLQVLMLLGVPMLFLAGFAWPAEAMPRPLLWLGWLLPSSAGIDGFLRVVQMGAPLREVAGAWTGLWALALAYAGLAAWALRRRRAQRGAVPAGAAGDAG